MYTLKQTEGDSKSAKFIYQIIDESGKVIAERNSNREFVAATIDGFFFFGRLDLIGKGDHAKHIKEGYNMPIAYKS